MFRICIDPSRLTKEQREFAAAAILNFPGDLVAPNTVPSIPPIPSAPEPTPVPNAAAPAFDSDGLPWDERIHSSSKEITAKGVWRKRRGVLDDEVATVEAELKRAMAVPLPTDFPGPAPVPVSAVSAPEPVPAAAAAVPEPVADPKEALKAVVAKTTAAMQAKKLAKADLDIICITIGLDRFPDLQNNLDLVPAYEKELDDLLATR